MFQCAQDFRGVDHPADAFVAAGELAFGWADELAAIGLELVDVALGGGVEPHFTVHGRGDEDGGGAGEGEIDRGERIGGESMCE